MGASKIMVIRHAEKPGKYNGVKYHGVTATGEKCKESLVTLGWERAGALVGLFVPPWGPVSEDLATPAHLFAADPSEDSGEGPSADQSEDGPSQRPYETLTAVAAKLRCSIDTGFKKACFKHMADAALACQGVVLIAWQHQCIPDMADHFLKQTGTPAGSFPIPQKWCGDRYDLVWVFDRHEGSGPIKHFTQVPQLLLAGDKDSVLPTS